MSDAAEWVDGLRAQTRNFARTRKQTPVVRVTLLSGENFYVESTEPGPGDSFVTFGVFPGTEKVLEKMVRDNEGDYHTARVIVVSLHQLQQVDILYDAARSGTIGFRAPED